MGRTFWTIIVLSYLALCVFEYVTVYGNPQGMWYRVSKTSQWLALSFGRLGLYAEARFHEAKL